MLAHRLVGGNEQTNNVMYCNVFQLSNTMSRGCSAGPLIMEKKLHEPL